MTLDQVHERVITLIDVDMTNTDTDIQRVQTRFVILEDIADIGLFQKGS
jgi:hypothetical protein